MKNALHVSQTSSERKLAPIINFKIHASLLDLMNVSVWWLLVWHTPGFKPCFCKLPMTVTQHRSTYKHTKPMWKKCRDEDWQCRKCNSETRCSIIALSIVYALPIVQHRGLDQHENQPLMERVSSGWRWWEWAVEMGHDYISLLIGIDPILELNYIQATLRPYRDQNDVMFWAELSY